MRSKADGIPTESDPNGDSDELVAELDLDDVQAEDTTESAIERKYDTGQARIVIQRNDFLVPNILSMVENREILDISPSYQRRGRWNDTKRSHLIESLLMNVPIPPIFLFERDLAKYEVMDGQQRLTAIRAFFKNEFKLRDLKKWPELNKRFYKDLPPRIQAGLQRRGLAAVIILTETSQDAQTAIELRQYVFERLNTGGQQLNRQEVRNCIYAGKFNDILVSLARSPLFTRIWGIPPKETKEPQVVSTRLEKHPLYSTMADCEIVLRYFAFSDMAKFKGGVKGSLDSFMNEMKQASAKDCQALAEEYLSVLKIGDEIYGDKLFRLLNKNGELKGRRSVPLADATLLAIRKYQSKHEKLVQAKDKILQGTIKLLKDTETYEILVGRGNTKKAIEVRIDKMSELVKSVM